MSVYSFAVFGLQLPMEKLFQKSGRETIAEYDRFNLKLKGYRVHESFDFDFDICAPALIACTETSVSDDCMIQQLVLPPTEDELKAFTSIMKGCGLWDCGKYGLYIYQLFE